MIQNQNEIIYKNSQKLETYVSGYVPDRIENSTPDNKLIMFEDDKRAPSCKNWRKNWPSKNETHVERGGLAVQQRIRALRAEFEKLKEEAKNLEIG